MDEKQRARYQHMKDIWQKLNPGASFEEMDILILQTLADEHEDARVAAVEGKKIFPGTLAMAGDFAIKKLKRSKQEAPWATYTRMSELYDRKDPKTGKVVPMTAHLIHTGVYQRDRSKKRQAEMTLKKH